MKQYKIGFSFLGLLFLTQLTAQSNSRVIRGVVTDAVSWAPLEGVEILAKSSKLQSGSQTDGIFSIPVTEKDSILVFRFDGYEAKEISLTTDNELNVQLHKASEDGGKLSFPKLSGTWRGVFTIKQGVEAPFQFAFTETGSEWTVVLLNGEERFPTGTPRIVGDSVFIPLPLFENELALKAQNNTLEGVLRKQDLRGDLLPVKAEKGINYRFSENGSSPLKDITGRYDVVFQNAAGKEEKAVGIFRQQGNKVTATFLRITGDSRYLEGIIEDNRVRLSAFIGSVPSLYTAIVNADGTLKGEGQNIRGTIPFTAVPNSNAALPDAYTLTHLKEGNEKLNFKFPDADGKLITATDAKFAGKPLVITIGGTWCPNCIDEAAFLGPWYEKNKQRGIEVISLQYERQTDAAYVKKTFDRFRKQFGIEYTLLLGGVADKQAVVASLPALQNFLSFPTTLFVGRDGKVKKIHTGFTGPATGSHYADFIKEFNEEVDQLLK